MVQKAHKRFLATILLGSAVSLVPITSASAAEVTVGWNTDNVVITNNVGKPDVVKVGGLVEGAVVKVYSKATNGTLLGTGVVKKGQTEAIISIANIGSEEGKLYVSVTLESEAAEVSFEAEAQSTKVAADKVTIVNN
ncbi:hypothetical protein SAMN04488542_1191, partial [Fontibacillus panacisegetis]